MKNADGETLIVIEMRIERMFSLGDSGWSRRDEWTTTGYSVGSRSACKTRSLKWHHWRQTSVFVTAPVSRSQKRGPLCEWNLVMSTFRGFDETILLNRILIRGNKYNTVQQVVDPIHRYLQIMLHSKLSIVCDTRGCSFSVQNYDAEKASNATDLLPSTKDTPTNLTCQPRLDLRPQMDV